VALCAGPAARGADIREALARARTAHPRGRGRPGARDFAGPPARAAGGGAPRRGSGPGLTGLQSGDLGVRPDGPDSWRNCWACPTPPSWIHVEKQDGGIRVKREARRRLVSSTSRCHCPPCSPFNPVSTDCARHADGNQEGQDQKRSRRVTAADLGGATRASAAVGGGLPSPAHQARATVRKAIPGRRPPKLVENR